MQGLGGEPAVTPPGPALPPQLQVQLPPGIGMSTQVYWDPVEAARAGRLKCLQFLNNAGRFLDLSSPKRAEAGEARRAEAWLAALAACKAGHAHVLTWLFRGGWPPSFNADPPWHLRDVAESWIEQFGSVPKLQVDSRCWRQAELDSSPAEVQLYHSAMQTPACLDALLDAGARSPWICRAAVLEGRADLLRLAVARGCPCDAECLFSAAREGRVEVLEAVLSVGLDLLLETTNRLLPNKKDYYKRTRSVANLVQQAGVEAAARDQVACLEALLRWHPDLLCGSSHVAHAAARAGNLNLLQLLERAGFKEWDCTTEAAAARPDNLPCLSFALAREGWCRAHMSSHRALIYAAQAGSMENLEALHATGFFWCADDAAKAAIRSGNLDAVNFLLMSFGYLASEAEVMETAISERNPAAMELLYEAGHPPGLLSELRHPALRAITAGTLEGAQIAVKYSGVPALLSWDTREAAYHGEAMLRYVHEFCGTLHEGTAAVAAGAGQLGALRYAIESGAFWDQGVLAAAIEADSLECLRYAHEGGCPLHPPGEPLTFAAARSLPVLRYVCEHMGPTWSAGVLHITAAWIADRIRRAKAGESLDWQLALYTVQQNQKSREAGMLGEDPPPLLAEAVRVRRERAAALAGAFFKAGQLAQVHAAHSSAPPWRAMAALPCDLRERIAFHAHLVLPPAPLC